ncbi:MAG: AsmA family protein [Halorhodospira sp.]
MPPLLKWTVLVLSSLLLLLAVATTARWLAFDPEAYREELAAAVEERTGRTLEVPGEVQLSVFPWPSLQTGRIELADREGYHEAPFLEIAGIEASLRLLPLLRGELHPRQVRIDEPVLRLMLDAEGGRNWADLLARLAAEEPEGDAAATVLGAGVEGLQVRRGEIHWTRQGSDRDAAIERLDLDLGAVRPAAPIPLRAQLRARGEGLPRLNGQLAMTAVLDDQLDTLQVEDLTLDVEGEGLEMPGYRQRLGVTGEGSIGLGEPITVEWPQLTVTGAGAELITAARLELKGGGAHGQVDWEVPALNLRTVLSRLDADVPATESTTALTRVNGEGRLELAGERLRLAETQLQIDETDVGLTGTVEASAGPQLAFDLTADEINLDRYRPAGDRRAATEPSAPQRGPELEEIALDLPLEPLRTLQLDGGVRIDRMTAAGLELDQVEVALSGEDGRVGVSQAQAQLYGGSYAGEAFLEAGGEYPHLALDQQLNDVRLAPLLEDLTGQSWLQGRGSLVLQGEGGGADLHALVEDFRGEAQIEAEEGAVQGLDLPHMFRAGVARIRAERPPEPPEETARTAFTSLSAGFELADGGVRNDDLRAASSLLRARGSGEANLLEPSLDYRLFVSVAGPLEDIEGRPLRELRDVEIPLTLRGDLLKPWMRFELRDGLNDEQIEQLREVQQRRREAVAQVREGFRERLMQELREQTDRSEAQVRNEVRSILQQLR